MLDKVIFVLMLILIFACVVIIHEWGHFIMAKKNGVLVHEFAMGMGPKVWSVQKGETLYSIRLLPIGGFCSMEEEVGSSDNPKAMSSKKPWQKFLIVVAGAVMNFILAWILMSIVVGYIGCNTNEIATLQENMPAVEAGLQVGDKITAINGEKVKKLADLSNALSKEEATYNLVIKHVDGKEEAIALNTKKQEDGVARFGFTVTQNHFNILYNLESGFVLMVRTVEMIWRSLIQLLTGEVGMDQMAGIVGVVDQTSKQWDQSVRIGGLGYAVIDLLYVGAILSANLGIFNLLPFPALDGGRLVFIIIEMIRGKAVSAEKEGAVHFIGMVLLMLLTVVVLYNDLIRMGIGR
ncbi:M50 family metallopeptidase [Cellulosilyticum ruminicola]|uniref:M50 family metallopeptidase n=1 Tax=Cellulosilyticum ruminicola TaxID=425254 RepID=UPI0006D25188|nr:M50 family metallopeptidase [Cellulosilyticum ruminicola]